MRLLLAEDEEDLSRALVTVLKHNNYSVDAVYDGAEALDYLENGDNYDGVILDIMMPKKSTLKLCIRLPSPFYDAQNGWYHRIKNNPQTWKFRSGPAAHSKGRD